MEETEYRGKIITANWKNYREINNIVQKQNICTVKK